MMVDILVLGCVLGVMAWLGRIIGEFREAHSRRQCSNNLKQIALALHNYQDSWGQLPPAVTLGPDGKPWHSWRVLILPFLESSPIYPQYRFDEPWDGPNNRKLHAIRYRTFFCPSHPDHQEKGQASYVMFMGKGTAFPGPNKSTRLEDVTDGTAATIAVVESATLGPHWMEPRDLELDRMSLRLNDRRHPGISSPHPGGGANAAFLDGSVRLLKSQSLSPEILRALLTIQGGEPPLVPPD
jgi:prepilin-type processing-associated H-X9-DG protein